MLLLGLHSNTNGLLGANATKGPLGNCQMLFIALHLLLTSTSIKTPEFKRVSNHFPPLFWTISPKVVSFFVVISIISIHLFRFPFYLCDACRIFRNCLLQDTSFFTVAPTTNGTQNSNNGIKITRENIDKYLSFTKISVST